MKVEKYNMSKHKDSKHCQCAGCQDANGMSSSNILNIVSIILQHGGKLEAKKIQSVEVMHRGYNRKELQLALLEDAGVS